MERAKTDRAKTDRELAKEMILEVAQILAAERAAAASNQRQQTETKQQTEQPKTEQQTNPEAGQVMKTDRERAVEMILRVAKILEDRRAAAAGGQPKTEQLEPDQQPEKLEKP